MPSIIASVLSFALGAACVPAQPSSALQERLRAGEAAAVLSEVKALSRAGSADLEHLLVGCEAALVSGSLADARALADQAERRAPEDPRPHTCNGHALYAMAEDSRARGGGALLDATLADAVWHYREARRLGGSPYDNGFWEAEIELQRGRATGALEAIDAALAARPGDLPAGRLRSRALLGLGRRAEAIAELEKLREAHPGDPTVAELLLVAVLEEGGRDHIRRVFLAGAKDHPELQILYGRLFGHFQDERPGTWLRETLEAAAAARPEAALPRWYLGCFDETIRGDLEGALGHYRSYSAARGTAEGSYHVGRVLVLLGRAAEARDALLRANALRGLDPEALAGALSTLVALYVERGEFESAARIQDVVRANTPTLQAQLDLGVLVYNAGRREQGIEIYRQLLRRDDLDLAMESQAENYLALGLWGSGRREEAEAALGRSLVADEENLDARENLGVLLVEAGRGEEAARHLRLVLAGDPVRDRSRYHLMRALHSRLLSGGQP